MTLLNKFINTKYLRLFQKEGTLALGNMEMYRQTEIAELKDLDEGVRRWSSTGEAMSLSENDMKKIIGDSNSSIRTTGKNKNAPLVHLSPGAIANFNVTYPNAIVFSTSSGDIDTMLRRFNRNNYFTILNVEKFGKILLNQVKARYEVIAYCFDWIRYVDTKNTKLIPEVYKNNVIYPPLQNKQANITGVNQFFGSYFTKEKRFEDEKEFRFVFLCSQDIPKDHFVIKVKSKYFKKIIKFNED